MYYARVEAWFSAAHFLSHYRGKCEKLHGHNYKVRLWVRGEELDEGGMLADFSLLKKALKETLEPLDHSNLNDIEFFKRDSAAGDSSTGDSTAGDPNAGDPSAERIARFVFEKLREKLPELGVESSLLYAVDVYETEGSMARYTMEVE